MLGTREYALCSPFRANAHNSSLLMSSGAFDDSESIGDTLNEIGSEYY